MKKIKVLAEVVSYPGGRSLKGDIVDVPDKSADYFIANGYAELYIAEVNKVYIEPKEEQPKKKRGRPRKIKMDD